MDSRTPVRSKNLNAQNNTQNVAPSNVKKDDSGDPAAQDFKSVLRDFSSVETDDQSKSKDSKDADKKQKDNSKTTAAPVDIAAPRKEVLPVTLSIPKATLNTTLNTTATAEHTVDETATESGDQSSSETELPAKTEPVAAPDKIDTTAAGPTKGELAFAAKLTPNAPVVTDAPAPHAETNPKAAAAIQKTPAMPRTESNAIEADRIRPIAAVEPVIKITPAIAHEGFSSHAAPAPRIESATPLNAVNASARLEQILELRPTPPANPSDITVRIADAASGTDLRFVDRAGEVHVSVRTGDAEMAQALRGGLTDFTARLEQGGIKAEMWRPNSNNSENSSSQDQYGRKSGDQRNANRDRGGADEQEANRDSNKPKWVEALELSIGRQA